MKKRKLRPRAVYLLLILLALIVSIAFVAYNISYNKKVNTKNAHYVSLSIEEKPAEIPESISIPSEEKITENIDDYDRYVPYLTDLYPDFDALLAENSDVIGYICIPGTEISYPVMQREDNEYYLRHNFDGSIGYPGCIYMEIENSKNFDDQVTVLYGHNMKSGAMFRGLHNYTDIDFMTENKYIFIYTPEGISVYEIFMASNYGSEHIFNSNYLKFPDGYKFKGFKDNQNEITVAEIMEYNAKNLTINDKSYDYTKDLLVLSTCDKGNKRLVVVAKKIEL